MINFYSCLGVSEVATQDEIRRAYYKKMLAIHPDRTSNENTSSSQIINSAWEVLKDPVKRLTYDTNIKVRNSVLEGYAFCEEVTIDDLTPTNDDDSWTVECRCGGGFNFTKEDINYGFRYFCCSNCSLKINLKVQ